MTTTYKIPLNATAGKIIRDSTGNELRPGMYGYEAALAKHPATAGTEGKPETQWTTGDKGYSDQPHKRQESAQVPESVIAAIATLIDHAGEMYPHFESNRGQQDIQNAKIALDYLRLNSLITAAPALLAMLKEAVQRERNAGLAANTDIMNRWQAAIAAAEKGTDQ